MVLALGNGLRITGLPFVLDAPRPVPFAFASHAHADHCGHHRKILCTAPTADLARARYGPSEFVTIPEGEASEIARLPIELLPAGHVLGSAQLMMQLEGTRILFTGDLKPPGGKTTPPAATPPCDILIIEATYGHPEYLFPPTAETVAALATAIKRAFVRGLTPVILAYGLGKAQEAMALLEDQGFTFACHRLIYQLVKIYRKWGGPLPGAELFDADHLKDKVVVMPPGMPRSREWSMIRNPYTVFLSGWAMHPARRRGAVDLTLPLSDHADYSQLVEFIARTKARIVYTFHGFPELSRHLREQGLTARHLKNKDQVDLLTGRTVKVGASFDLFNSSEN